MEHSRFANINTLTEYNDRDIDDIVIRTKAGPISSESISSKNAFDLLGLYILNLTLIRNKVC